MLTHEQQAGASSPNKRSCYLIVLVVALYAAWLILLIPTHELWTDETDVWLAAKSLSLKDLFGWYIRDDGHPALWFLLLMPFADAGLPIETMQVVNGVIMVAAVAVFMVSAPFSLLTKILWVCSAPIAYQYSVVARNYGVMTLMLFTVATLYSGRFERPWRYALAVLFLMQTHAFVFVTGGMLVVCYGFELWKMQEKSWRQRGAWLLMAVGVLAAFAELVPLAHGPGGGLIHRIDVGAFLLALGNGWLPGYILMSETPWLHNADAVYVLGLTVLAGGAVMVMALSVYGRTLPYAIFAVSLLWLWYVFTFKVGVGFWHQAVIPQMTLFFLWIGAEHREQGDNTKKLRPLMLCINLCLFYSCVVTPFLAYRDYRYPFSAAKGTMEFIHTHTLEDRTFILNDDIALAAYLPPGHVWIGNTGQYFPLIMSDTNHFPGMKYVDTNEAVLLRAEKEFSNLTGKVLVTHSLLSPELRQRYGLQLVYGGTGFVYRYEDAWVYMPTDDAMKMWRQ